MTIFKISQRTTGLWGLKELNGRRFPVKMNQLNKIICVFVLLIEKAVHGMRLPDFIRLFCNEYEKTNSTLLKLLTVYTQKRI